MVSRRKLHMMCAVAVAVTLSLTGAGCGDEDDAPATGAAGGGQAASTDELRAYEPGKERRTAVDASTFTTPKPSKKYVIGVAFPHFKDPYWIAEAYGVQKRADELGVEVRIQGAKGYGDTATQMQQLDTYMTQNVDGIVLGAVDSKGIAPAADRAWNQGIPVAYANALAESKKSMGVYTDDDLAGVRQAQFVAKEDPEAQVIAFCGPPGVVWPKLRCEGFERELKAKAPKAKILTKKFHDMDRAKIADIASNTLEAFPKATWVFNSTDLQAKGVIDALRARGKKPGEMKITNLTIGEELFGLMKQGWITYALSERAVLQGRLALDQLIMVLEGEKPPANWAIDLPGFEGIPADIARFQKGEDTLNWSPKGYRP